ncbi:MAG: thiamine pyrophosphate-binding protein [Rhizobiales bacterium]|nr:thiamine pyrophosphate-binding protein [Hyphomicrobiales bacterium]
MAKVYGGAAVVDALRKARVSHVFGLLGSTTMEVYDALYHVQDEIAYVGVRHEAFGVHMADGFGRASNTPGVFLAGQAGPGAVNMVPGLIQAKLAYSPVVAITGLVTSAHYHRDTMQEVDQHSLFAPVVKKNITVIHPDRVGPAITEALEIANSGRRGPVVVNIPRDLYAAEVPSDPRAPDYEAGSIVGSLNPRAVARAAELLRSARSPVILAGAGVKWGRGADAVVRLSNQLRLPVVASAGNPDVVPGDHPYFGGQVGPRGNEVASAATRNADVILALGTRLSFNTTFFSFNDINRDARIVQVDVEPSALGRHFPIEIGMVADAGTVATALSEALSEWGPGDVPWQAHADRFCADVDALWRVRDEAGANTATPLHPDRVFRELRQSAPREALFTLDAGTLCLQITDKLRYLGAPPSLMTTLDYGLIGFSFPCGLGAKCAQPERPVISLHGDGGFCMTMVELATAMQHGINTVTVVMDNGCWGAEKAYQREFYQGRYIGCDTINPRYDEFARLYGAKGYFCEEPGSVADAVAEALKADCPAIIHVKVDPDVMTLFRRDSFAHRPQRQ